MTMDVTIFIDSQLGLFVFNQKSNSRGRSEHFFLYLKPPLRRSPKRHFSFSSFLSGTRKKKRRGTNV